MNVLELGACTGKTRPATERACIQVCLGCIVRPECLNKAIRDRDVTRPRGGLSTNELRRAMGSN